MPKSKKEIIEKLKKAGMSLRKSPWLERAKERQKERTYFYCQLENNPAHGKCVNKCNHCKEEDRKLKSYE